LKKSGLFLYHCINQFTIIHRLIIVVILGLRSFNLSAQQSFKIANNNRNTIVLVGIVKNISDSALLDIVQRQTFRYFWARERDNTVKANYHWDYINEADDITDNKYC
jgi:hypothetical protein